MTKIKYGKQASMFTGYGNYRNYKKSTLYKYAVFVPGWMSALIATNLTFGMLAINLHEAHTGNELSVMFTVLLIVGMVGLVMGLVYCLVETPGWHVLGFKYHFPKRKLPDEFDNVFVDNHLYQEALQEHWRGIDIGSMSKLNAALRQVESIQYPQKSDVVDRLAERAIKEKEFIQMGVMK